MQGPRALELSFALRVLGAAASGAAVGLAFAPTQVWPLALVGLAALTLLLSGRSFRATLGMGYAFGIALCAVAISWLYGLGWWIAVLLCAFMALFFMGYAVAAKLAMRLPWWPVWCAGCWMAMEFVYCRWPFGGFGWIRLGFTAIDTPLSGLYQYIGVTGVGFLTALLAQLLAWTTSAERGARLQRVVAFVGALALTLASGIAGWSAKPPAHTAASLVVGIVQGNINGVDPREPFGRARTVTLNHLSETVNLMAKARTGQLPEPDMILWPENSTDVDPTLDSQTQRIVMTASQVSGKPILVGAVLEGPGPDERQTGGLWWEPGGLVTARYYKRNIVPFGEYIPYRDFLLPKIPILELTGAQSVPGTKPGAIPATLTDGRRMIVGDVICFELAWDNTVYDTVRNGAGLLLVQSNNASYGGTAQIPQQWAMTRARAMETGRDVAVATTNSYSGVIRADGTVVTRSNEFEAWSTSEKLAVRDGLTPAITWAPLLEVTAAAMGLAGTMAGAAMALAARRRRA